MNTDTYIIYDGECPFCSNYVKMLKLKESIGPVRLINAREGGTEVNAAREAGLDLDEGMILHLDGQMYHGDECVNRLALLSSRLGMFNRINAAIFQSPRLSKVLYPVLRFGRNAVIRLLGKKKLAQSNVH